MSNFTMRTQRGQPRRTKIVATLGPASNTPQVIAELIDTGLNVARINFSHGTHEEHAHTFQMVRQAAREAGKPVAILLDLSGQKMRCSEIEGGAIDLAVGETMTFVRGSGPGTKNAMTTTYDALIDDLNEGDPVYLDDGNIRLSVLKKEKEKAVCKVEVGGKLKSKKGINLPGSRVSAAALTDKDVVDLEFGAKLGADFVALSFVREPEHMLELRKRLEALGSKAKTVAKIEKPQALDKLDAIIAASDGVMVARGDLGVEMPVEKVPGIQKRIVRAAANALKFSIVATQMLESMVTNPRPTRAEVSDIANAIEDGCDAVMLSAESASGAWPVLAVHTMSEVAHDAEQNLFRRLPQDDFDAATTGDPLRKAMVAAAAHIAGPLKAKFLVVRSETGETARYFSKLHGTCPIVAMHTDDAVLRKHALYWGVMPVKIEQGQNRAPTMEEEVSQLAKALMRQRLVFPSDHIVVISRYPQGTGQPPNNIQAIRVDEAVRD